MEKLVARIKQLEKLLHEALQKVSTLDELEQTRISFIGRNGSIPELMSQLKELSLEEKKVAGPLLNQLRAQAQELISQKHEALQQALLHKKLDQQKNFDVTAYAPTDLKGTLHIFTYLIEQLEDIFISMGFQVATGPEVETEYYNFSALNIPADHPARELHDTFWLTTPNFLLRTHTSTVQVRVMEEKKAPLAVFAPGRVYRNEATDATHDFMFMQAEGMLIDKNISISNLLATAKQFLQNLFEKKDLQIRVRPGYFPFVEPGLEIDAQCPFCTNGCSTCKKTTWIELLGAGLIHPNVLKAGGIDPNVYSGFAFGIGLERLAMIKYGIGDIRLFRNNNIEFLNQF
jgi:phenylalanyl-tRNA synthetase alpha chain